VSRYPSPSPAESTRPSGNSTAIEWYARCADWAAMRVQVSVTGSKSSACFGMVPPPLPPTASTVPSGRSKVFWSCRARFILAVGRHCGVAAEKSMMSAVLVVCAPLLPPLASTLFSPGRSTLLPADLSCAIKPMGLHVFVAGSKSNVWRSGPALKILPSGNTCILGYRSGSLRFADAGSRAIVFVCGS
jgi:hypothetical protein